MMKDAVSVDSKQLLAEARQVLRAEAQSVLQLADRLDASIAAAITAIYAHTASEKPGAVVVSGLGKSGLAGQRISASFASTGTPSHFLHPVEALHGDLGRVRRDDIALLISYGGETDELIRLLDHLKRLGVPAIALTSRRGGSLGRLADIAVELGAIEEACPLRLAPTTSLACIHAVADAMVLGVMSLRKFSAEDFAAFHPGGALGRKLLRVGEVMSFRVGENAATAPANLSVREALARDKPSGRRAGALMLVNEQGVLAGIFTDADLRRRLLQFADLLDRPVAAVMTAHPKRIRRDALASEALALLNQYRIDELPVVDEADKPVGLIDVQDVLALRLVE
jgi:arabinose-5-phosphate isomerase